MAFLVILLWLLEFVLALAFLGWLEERMERSVANASTWDAEGSSSGAVGHVPPADLVERGPGAENPSSAASGTGAAPDVESAVADTDGQGYPPMSSLWRRPVGFLNENSLARSLMVTVLIIVTILATAAWLDNSAADRQEVASNTSFVQQVAFDPTAEVKPFTEFNLHGARLSGLPLGCINLTPPKGCAELGSANLSEADLSGANLVGAFLHSADLSAAFMASTDLTDGDLRQANLSAANLNNAILTGADMRYADLTGATMIQANLRGADLRGTYLASADITNANLRTTCYDNSTTWPATYQPSDPPDCSTASSFP